MAEIRRLGPHDLPRMRALNAMFAAAFEDPESYGAAPPGDSWLTDVLAREDVVALAAEADGAVVGGLVAYELMKFEQARRELYIYDLAVDAGHRRRGVATALIRWLQRRAAERGAYVIFVQADHGDDPAIALYESLGEREEVLHFDIPPAGDEGETP
jgi:aminoglycoside 3-N-acetyltransferase I